MDDEDIYKRCIIQQHHINELNDTIKLLEYRTAIRYKDSGNWVALKRLVEENPVAAELYDNLIILLKLAAKDSDQEIIERMKI